MTTMMRRLVFILITLLGTAGSIQAQDAEETQVPVSGFEEPGIYNVGFIVGGLERMVEVYIPPAYFEQTEPVPLLLVLHGAGGSGRGIAEFSEFASLADDEGFVLAFPDGYNGAWNDARPDARVARVDDVTFLRRVITFMDANLNLDERNVFAAGYSMGGMMSFRLGCQLQDNIAAVASVASTFPAYLLDSCLFVEPVPVLLIQGTEDEVIPPAGYRDPLGNRMMLSVDETMRYWSETNVCAPTPTRDLLPDADPNDGTRVRARSYSACANDADVTVLLVRGGGHSWPGHVIPTSFDIGRTSMDIDATEAIWSFFEAHRREPADE